MYERYNNLFYTFQLINRIIVLYITLPKNTIQLEVI